MKTIFLALALTAYAGTALADSGKTPPGQRENNWGEITSDATRGPGNSLGDHSKSFAGSRRSGLANAVNKGDLSATADLVEAHSE